MAYKCPKCGGVASRAHSPTAQQAAGLVGALIYMAFAGLSCVKCGKLQRSEFSDEDRGTMVRNSVLLFVGGLVLLAACVGLLIAIND
ncbi:MAG: hypothetical protein H6Q89_3427 [Myxococcaceae bacterium]|nr:hypothetical protein [Myxococcaceae bacterium]